MKEQTDCKVIGQGLDEDSILHRDFLIERNGTHYIIRVATADHLAGIRAYNADVGLEARLDDNYFPVADLSDPVEICCQLADITFEQLQPFLTEQIEN